jgi:Domain of unknown function (DUF4232)
MSRTGLRIGAVAVAALLATGCTAKRAGAPPVGAPGGSPSAAPSASPSTGATPSPSGSASAPSGLHRCHTADLTGHVEGHGAGSGQRYAALGLTNRTGTPCTVYGYPGLQLVDGTGAVKPTTVDRDRATGPTTLLVAPGQTVWAVLHWTVIPADDEAADHCAPDPKQLRVIPPDETTQLSMPFDYDAICQHGHLTVGPFTRTRPVDG